MNANVTEPVTTSDYFEKKAGEEPLLPGPGERLQNRRESLGLTLSDVASHLNLRVTILEAIERNDYRQIPKLVFARGYLRAYAKLLGIPGNEIIETFNQLQWPEPKPDFIAPPLRSGQKRKLPKKEHSSAHWIGLMVIIAIFAIAGFWKPITEILSTHNILKKSNSSRTVTIRSLPEETTPEKPKSVLPDLRSPLNLEQE